MFAVPGWSVPSAPVVSSSQTSKKRKRPTADEGAKLQSAAVNMDKLMKKLDGGDGEPDRRASKKKRGGKEKAAADEGKGEGRMPNQKSKARGDGGGREQKQKQKTTHAAESSKGPTKTDTPTPAPAKKSKRKDNAKPHDAAQPTAGSAPAKPIRSKPTDETPGLTAMQRGMKESLDGARFRWINEVLYKTDSAQAHQMMQEDPKVYQEYHTGFRHQVQSWPTNPVSHYISVLSSYPAKTVIADLGCGDAALARALIPKGKVVLSFDLVSDGAYVVEADTCGKLPLPGSEATDTNLEGEGHVVDVVVCALSLMGTNWLNCVREAWRILKPSGELKIAEVASRFTDVGEFTKLIGAVGFDLKSKDDRNSHFTLFEFKKEATVVKTDAEWAKLMSKGSTLKPCEYKRR